MPIPHSIVGQGVACAEVYDVIFSRLLGMMFDTMRQKPHLGNIYVGPIGLHVPCRDATTHDEAVVTNSAHVWIERCRDIVASDLEQQALQLLHFWLHTGHQLKTLF